MKIIGMIPARLGSKRIPLKNIRYMDDRPLIQYPIDIALSSQAVDELWVNTEDERLGAVIQKMGARFHKRPVELASDTATNRDFTYEFMKQHPCDYVVMINPTSPLLREDTFKRFVQYILDNDFDVALSVISEKEETFFQGKPLNFSLEKKLNSQLLEPIEKIIWALTAWKSSYFIKMQERGLNPVFGYQGKLGRFPIPKDESCDLDTEEDWRIAEGILQARKIEAEKRYIHLKSD